MKKKTSSKKLKAVADEYPKSFETFKTIGDWEIRQLKYDEPTAFNGWVRFKKYKVTVEEIAEPIEIYYERLQKLWLECDNHHHYHPLKRAALDAGITLIHDDFGKNRKRAGV